MKLSSALKNVIAAGNAQVGSACMYSALADFIGADYAERDKLARLEVLDKQLMLVQRLQSGDMEEVKRIKNEFSPSLACTREEFDEVVDAVAAAFIPGLSSVGTQGTVGTRLPSVVGAKVLRVKDCLNNETALMGFSLAQLQQYCRDNGIHGYSSLNKKQLVALVMNGANRKKSAPVLPKRTPKAGATHRTRHYRGRTNGWVCFGLVMSALVVAGCAVCLWMLFGHMDWKRWQHVAGAVGGFAVSLIGVLIVFGVGRVCKKIGATIYSPYQIAGAVEIALFAIANILMRLWVAEYAVIFYWVCGYLFVLSVVLAIAGFENADILPMALGIVETLIAAVSVCVFAFWSRWFQLEWWQWQYIIGSLGGLVVCGLACLIGFGLGWILEEVIITSFDGYIFALPIAFLPFVVANFVLALTLGGAYNIIFYWMSGYLVLPCVVSAHMAFYDGETFSAVWNTAQASVTVVLVVVRILLSVFC